jgi:hypothetical protein
MTLQSLAGGLPNAAAYRFSLDGEFAAAYGEKLRPEWNSPLASSQLRHRNEGFLAASDDGHVFIVLRWWPWIRKYRDGELVWERWLDYEWLEARWVPEQHALPRDLVETIDDDMIDENQSLSAPINFDIATSSSGLFVLMNGGGFLLVLDHQGGARASYRLLGGDPALLPGADVNIPFVDGLQIGVDPAGRRVCAPLHRHAVVYCYDLPQQEKS